METTTKEIAAILRSTETMADRFAQLVQERVGQPVPQTEILDVMQKMPIKSLTMGKVVGKIKQEREKRRKKEERKRKRKSA
ncbi:MAG: hypothetical protein PVF45_07285 [Anaerolineae bacterium]|jgi:hypothetical protein